jgi:hypothetical protein
MTRIYDCLIFPLPQYRGERESVNRSTDLAERSVGEVSGTINGQAVRSRGEERNDQSGDIRF